jgi:hypothetical protein
MAWLLRVLAALVLVTALLSPVFVSSLSPLSELALKAVCRKAADGQKCDCIGSEAVLLPGARQPDQANHYMGTRAFMSASRKIPITTSRRGLSVKRSLILFFVTTKK